MIPARSRRSAQTRDRILAAATGVFARRGLHGTRVADIAEAADMAYGLVYHHFRNKEEILAAIYGERWSQYVHYLEELAASDRPFSEQLGKLVHFWVEVWRTDPDLMTVMINEISRSYEFIESHDIGTVLVVFETVERMLERARAQGEVRGDVDARLVAYAVLGIAEMVLTGYVLGSLRRSERDDYQRDEHQIVRLLLHGLLPGPP